MGKSSGSAPAAPDPYITAKAQGEQDRQTLQYGLNNSRTSTVNPFGSTSWSNSKTFDQAGWDKAMAAYNTPSGIHGSGTFGSANAGDDGGNGNQYTPDTYSATTGQAPSRSDFEGTDHWTNTQTLSPESQGIYDTSTSKLNDALGNMSTDANAYNSKVADALYSKMRLYQDPLNARAASDLQSNLADRGFSIGDAAASRAMTDLGDVQQRGQTEASNNAVIAGQQAGQQQLSMQQQIAQTLSNLRNQQVAGVSGMPTTTTTPSIQAPDIAGMINNNYTNAMNKYNADNASNDGMWGNLLKMGTSIAMAPGTGGVSLAGGFFGK